MNQTDPSPVTLRLMRTPAASHPLPKGEGREFQVSREPPSPQGRGQISYIVVNRKSEMPTRGSKMLNLKSKIQNRKSDIEKLRAKIEERKSKVQNRKAKRGNDNRKSGIANRQSAIGNRQSSDFQDHR
jgi:hypothetical protein